MTELADEVASRLEMLGIPRGSYALEPLTRVQKFIAQRLTDAARDVPSFPLVRHVELDALQSLRTAQAAAGRRASVNDLVVKAAAEALVAVPQVNASYTADGLVRHRHADIAVAVATPSGLVTPIVRAADEKPADIIAAEMRDLAERARARRLKPDEYTGGTFSVSNLGMFGISSFGSIINPPHAAILSVGAAERRILAGGEAQRIATLMTVTLTCDHRVVDGATGAQWLQAFAEAIEQPVRLFSPSAGG